MYNINELLVQLESRPETVTFQKVMNVIKANYHYSPTDFSNGKNDDLVTNQAGENEGSCKLFAFALHQNLSESQTLHCFGDYYRVDVLEHPEAYDHANIRAFIKYGWDGIHFNETALTPY